MRVLLLVALGACGSSSTVPGDPILSGSLTGSYDTHAFTAAYGFATIYKNQGLVGLADSAVHCGSENMANPPPGSGVIASVDVLAVGSYPSAFFEIYRNVGGFTAVGSTGDLEITSVDADTLSGSITYMYTDASDGKMYSASGTFTVTHCPM